MLNLTHMNLSGKYIVHELHAAPPEVTSGGTTGPELPVHPNEIAGVNIHADSQQFWHNVGADLGVRVDAGLIEHRGKQPPQSELWIDDTFRVLVACVGYVFTEKLVDTSSILPRRVVCLGDTSSANHIVPLCVAEGIYPSLVVHESTNAWIPPHVDHKRLYGGARKT